MNNIRALAWLKFEDAQHLCEQGRHDSAFYIGGYAIELLLKARICKTLAIEDFFHFDGNPKLLSKEAYRPFKVHDFSQLIILSGIYNAFQKNFSDADLNSHWDKVNEWSEDNR